MSHDHYCILLAGGPLYWRDVPLRAGNAALARRHSALRTGHLRKRHEASGEKRYWNVYLDSTVSNNVFTFKYFEKLGNFDCKSIYFSASCRFFWWKDIPSLLVGVDSFFILWSLGNQWFRFPLHQRYISRYLCTHNRKTFIKTPMCGLTGPFSLIFPAPPIDLKIAEQNQFHSQRKVQSAVKVWPSITQHSQ